MSTDTVATITTPPDKYQQLLENYSSILEKTNNQLGLSINIAGYFVSSVSVLVGVASIVVAIYIWKNSKEQKERAERFFKELDKKYKERQEKEEQRIYSANIEYEKLIAEQKKELDKASAEGKKKIEETILELKAMKIATNAQINNPTASGTNTFVGGTGFLNSFYHPSMFCSNCGKNFQFNQNNSVFSGAFRKKVFCTHCGSENVGAF